MKLLTSLLAFLFLSQAAHAVDEPALRFDPDEVVLSGAKPGNKISWVGMVREFHGSVPSLRVVRGMEPAKGKGELSLAKGFDASCSLWAVGGIDEPMTVVRAGNRCAMSQEPIKVTALSGTDRITVHSSIVFGHYLARKNSAWRFAARDGSDLDLDGKINGQIVLALSAMGKLKGSPHPPAAIGLGDTLLLLDSDQMRATAVEVQK